MWKGNTNRLTDIENKLVLAKGELEVRGEELLPGNLGLAVSHYFILKNKRGPTS